jgi:hypothetical protein
MLRHNGIHEENVQVRGMIGYNDVRTFRCFSMPDFFDRIKTKQAHHVGPKNKYVKTIVLGSRELNNNNEEWKQNNGKEKEYNGNVYLPKKRQNSQKYPHGQK